MYTYLIRALFTNGSKCPCFDPVGDGRHLGSMCTRNFLVEKLISAIFTQICPILSHNYAAKQKSKFDRIFKRLLWGGLPSIRIWFHILFLLLLLAVTNLWRTMKLSRIKIKMCIHHNNLPYLTYPYLMFADDTCTNGLKLNEQSSTDGEQFQCQYKNGAPIEVKIGRFAQVCLPFS